VQAGARLLAPIGFRPKLDEFRSQRSSTIAAKSWRGPSGLTIQCARAAQHDRWSRQASSPVEFQTYAGTVGSQGNLNWT
jgi:hypothetical protein